MQHLLILSIYCCAIRYFCLTAKSIFRCADRYVTFGDEFDINPFSPRRAYRVRSTYRFPTGNIENPAGIYIDLHNTLGQHGIGNLQEAGDVCTGNIVALHAVLGSSIV